MSSDIFAAIDAAIGCQKCGSPLGESPSADFCGAGCQAAWHAGHVEPLTNYREAGHDFVVDAVRFNGPVEPTWDGPVCPVRMQGFSVGAAIIDETYHWPLADLVLADGTIERIYTDTVLGQRDWGTLTFDGRFIQVVFDHPFDQPPDPPTRDEMMARALKARRNRNIGPVSRPRAPRTINARGRR